jgi:DNA anti-recombination protein RmuC
MVVCLAWETIMEQLTPDDRIAAQEKALDATNCELALLRQHMDARFAGMRESTDAQFAAMRESTNAQFAAMRQYVDDGLIKLKLEMQLYVQQEIAKAVAKLDELKAQSDRNYRWSIGLQFSTLAAVLAVLARGLV